MPIASAMILAAGIGSRLEPLTSWRPKALMPVGDRPMLAHLASMLRAAGVTRLAVNAHHHAEELARFVHDSKSELGEIAVSVERDLLGTAGGVAQARALLGPGDALIWNGDIVADLDLAALGRCHDERHAEATLVVKIAEKNSGNVGVDAHGKIVRLRKETTAHGEVAGGFFLGVHVIGELLRESLPEVGCLIGDVYLPALLRGDTLRTFVFDGDFEDIGTPASYLEANLAWLAARQLSFWQGEHVHVEKTVDVRNSILGAGARVTGSGLLDSCVVWPGTTLALTVDHHRAILTSFGEANLSL